MRVDGRIVRDNVYGTLEEDVWRRDFTVNCLYYDHREHTVIDFTGGYADVRDRKLRLIGHASERYREDPVRMLRAVRFAGKLGFDIDGDTSRAIYDLAPSIEDIPPAPALRGSHQALHGRRRACDLRAAAALTGCSATSSRRTDACIEAEPDGVAGAMADKALDSTDARIGAGKPVTPGFLFAALLWGPVLQDSEACAARGMSDLQAYDTAGTDAIERQIHHVSLPRRFSLIVREIWGLQPRLVNRRGRASASRLLVHPRFRAAYDFLLLRAESGEDVAEHATWWTRLQEGGEDTQRSMVEDKRGPKRRRRRRRGRGTPGPESTEQPAM